MQRLRGLTLLLASLLVMLSLGACIKLDMGTREETRFYTLAPLAVQQGMAPVWTLPPGMTMGIGPVKLARYLDRPQIATSVTANEYHFAEFAYWAEPLTDNIGMVVRENLAGLLGSERLLPFPWNLSKRVDVSLQLIIEVIAMDGRVGDAAHLNLRWVLTTADGQRLVALEKFEINETVSEPGYPGLVAAWSRGFAAFSQRVAQVLAEQREDLP